MLCQQLDALAPRLWAPSGSIRVLQTPDDFYKYLVQKIRTARQRIFLASLYIGRSEQELVDELESRLRSNSSLKVSILADALRGTREAPKGICTASLLAPLAAKHPGRVNIHMYETPRMTPLLRWLLPKRFNEGVGLQHMKLYGFDDEVLLSGANLSSDYFTNRQDRYLSLQNKDVTAYFSDIFDSVANFSYHVLPTDLTPGFKLVAPRAADAASARRRLADLLKPTPTTQSKMSEPETTGTWVYPVCQFTPLGLGNELSALKALADAAIQPHSNWMLTAGYFNIAPPLREKLLQSRASSALVITASEEANGFFKSRGLSGQLPALYTELARQFAKRARHVGIKVKEWRHGIVNTPGGWSYHAKGLWVWPTGSEVDGATESGKSTSAGEEKAACEMATYIGSSNFTRRAYQHDLEAGAVLVTKDPDLVAALHAEMANLQSRATHDARDHPPSLLTTAATRVLGTRL